MDVLSSGRHLALFSFLKRREVKKMIVSPLRHLFRNRNRNRSGEDAQTHDETTCNLVAPCPVANMYAASQLQQPTSTSST